MKKFLSATWSDLIMVNFEVDTAQLEPLVPSGTELDLQDGKCFVSLVAFMFLDTRVMEFLIPFHVNFEEVNLRFYVTRRTAAEERRGVVFIKELVPRSAIALAARTLYGEPYSAWKMSHRTSATAIEYRWEKGDCRNSVAISTGDLLGIPEPGSHREFIVEHYWGYTKRGENRTSEYKVEHPKWQLFEVKDIDLSVDFRCTYGDRFAFLDGSAPYSVLHAKGSEVAVYKGHDLEM